MVFRSLIRCLRRWFRRGRKKQRDARYGGDVDLEEAIAAQLAAQARAGRSLSSTESIAAAIRQSQQRQRNLPSFGTLLENEAQSTTAATTADDGAQGPVKAAVLEMQSLTPRFMVNGKTAESPASILNAGSGSAATAASSAPSLSEDDPLKFDLSASQGPVPRRSSIFNPSREWV